MSKEENIRKKVNLTQEDMAVILKISRSQWALYELGLRDLSTTAMIRLNRIERSFLLGEDSISKHPQRFKEQEQKKMKWFEATLRENEFRQIACENKTARLKKNFEAAMKQLTLIEFLSKPTNKKDALHPGALEALIEKADKAFEKSGPLQLLKLEIKQEQLKQEAALLRKVMKGLKR